MNKIVPVPSRFNIEDNGYELKISFKWFTYVHLFYLLFAIVWNSFLIGWYTIALSTGNIIMIVFPILHVAAGIYISYLALSGIFNVTTITVSLYEIKISISPISLFSEAKTINVKDLKQLYIVEEKTRNKNGYSYSYILKAIDFQHKSIKILTLEKSEEAIFLENKLETFCKISDEPIEGEWKG